MDAMLAELEANPELGCLGGERFFGTIGPMTVQYWKSMEHLTAYARSMNNQHASPWAKLMKKGRESLDYGFWHEAFIVKAGQHESIYINCPPLMLGNCRGVDLVQVEGKNNSAAGRAGRSEMTEYPSNIGKPDY